MTSARRSAKNRRGSNPMRLLSIVICIITLALSAPAFAQGVQIFQRQTTIGGHQAALLIVGWQKDAAAVQKLFDLVVQQGAASYARLDWRNPASEVARINAAAGTDAIRVSKDVRAAFEAAEKVSSWTKGAFDIVSGGSWKDLKVGGSVKLKRAGAQVRFDPIIEGFLADLMLTLIYNSNMQNAMVKVGNIFRGTGQSIRGPWKIQVQDDEGTFARHAINLIVRNTGVATVSASQFRAQGLIDPRSGRPIAPPCKGVVVVSTSAALAQGLARGIFVLGPQKGMELLKSHARGMIVDNAGKFLRSPGF